MAFNNYLKRISCLVLLLKLECTVDIMLNLVVLLTFWSPSQVSTSGIPLTVVVSSNDRSIPISSKIVKLTIDNYTTILIRSWLKECLYC